MSIDKTAIRHAATVIVLRDRLGDPQVLMGQRGAKAAFMPNKFVFPGGAVDREDADIPLVRPLPGLCATRLGEDCDDDLSHALAVTAIRELWEETGQILGTPRHLGRHAARGLAELCRHRPSAHRPCAAILLSRHHPPGPPAPL